MSRLGAALEPWGSLGRLLWEEGLVWMLGAVSVQAASRGRGAAAAAGGQQLGPHPGTAGQVRQGEGGAGEAAPGLVSPHLQPFGCWHQHTSDPHRGSPRSCSQPAQEHPRAELLFSLLLTGRTEGAEGPAGAGEAGLGGQLCEEGGNGKTCPPKVPPMGSERSLRPRLLSPFQEAWLLSRERELREEMRKERDKEIEMVIQRLEADTSLAKEECERAAENR